MIVLTCNFRTAQVAANSIHLEIRISRALLVKKISRRKCSSWPMKIKSYTLNCSWSKIKMMEPAARNRTSKLNAWVISHLNGSKRPSKLSYNTKKEFQISKKRTWSLQRKVKPNLNSSASWTWGFSVSFLQSKNNSRRRIDMKIL